MLPTLTELYRNQAGTVQLMGLNLTGTLQDGEWEWTQNTCAVLAPIIRRREKRKKVGQLTQPNGLTAMNKLAFMDGNDLYYGGYRYWTQTDASLANTWRTMVPMGSMICIFPDKVIFDTVNKTITAMEQNTSYTSGEVTIKLAQADGSSWGTYTTGSTAPANPTHGQHWLDTGETPAVMKTWSEYTNMWVDEYTTCVSVEATGIGTGLKVDDAVEVSGLTVESLNGTWQLLAVGADRIVYTGVITQETTVTPSAQNPVTVKRACPDMDFIIEHNNRLWGCSSEKHEIYACALGDPTNWRRYTGISTDSYAVTVGSPGPFTGAAVVNSSVCFFKEDCIHKIYGTMPSNFQMTVDHYRGCEQGSGMSLVRINELVYYKSVFDVCAYDGTEVAGISQALGVRTWKNAVAGKNDRKLYISMQDDATPAAWHLLTCDTTTGLWMREDGVHALAFASCLTETFMLDSTGGLWALRTGEYAKNNFLPDLSPTQITDHMVYTEVEETDQQVPWLLRTGEIAARMPNNKFIGKIEILVELPAGTTLTVRVKKDNEDWETAFTVEARNTRRHTLPIYPRRCDRLQIELSGTGAMKLYNMFWLIEQGSEYGRA